MGPRARLARRLFLGLSALWALAAGSGSPSGGSGANQNYRQVLQQLMPLLGRSAASWPKLQLALQESFELLPKDLQKEILAQAEAGGVAWQAVAAYNLAGALPLSQASVQKLVPRAIALCLPRGEWQNGILGMAFLPVLEEPSWREEELLWGVNIGMRLELHFGLNSTIAGYCLAVRPEQWLGPGVPGSLALRYALLRGRTLEDALALVLALPPARPTSYLFYDCVEGVAWAATAGGDLGEPSRQLIVSGADGADRNLAYLREAVEANCGWLTPKKAVLLLQQALPGSHAVAADADARRAAWATTSQGVQELSI